ncbi:PRC-barrel domain-containing protein [Caballeronia arationis]|jgi:sporulation protein YlmC with PRC-barrel domain|uniref:Sporulation protein YlmC, PRC-barrel domain family n=1 Tax=Caballeronia arationis TaxID=1777142 RepID=A0A7Z7I9Y3_9BURK|nr:PRC-barrel domain-containing protein [Caballeronia arationis]SAK93313.1 PRC-barrel domain-containing protein [Caballeronia arationis]SOE81335.1 Sporulation protein YlmC, PRC-barrel domain family [Caballeronia arationis]
MSIPTSSASGGAAIVGKGAATAAGPGPDVMAASTIDGNTVISSDGDDVGSIKEIMLDVRQGRIAYAVMSSGGFLGIGDKLLAIPWSALTLDTDKKCFRLAATSEQVRNSPGFDKDAWPSMAEKQWASTVHQHYGREPYWSTDVSDTGATPPAGVDAPEAGGVKL